jgi:hypothetical protein
MPKHQYELPSFLQADSTRATYVRWLERKAAAHIKRDRKRGNVTASLSDYKWAIHEAVGASGGRDIYTHEALDWTLLSAYDNDESKKGRRAYKAKFGLLPTVDHLGDGTGPADFAICAWRTNGAKGDLTADEFFDLCGRVVNARRSLKAT